MTKSVRLPKGAVRPREAVVRDGALLAAHVPGGPDKLRLDFNENTVGCSPQVIEHI